jgi:heme A synthase
MESIKSSQRRLSWIAGGALILLVAAAAATIISGANPAVCSGSPTCLLSEGNVAALLHEGAALGLLLLLALLLGVAYRARATVPKALLWVSLAFLALLTTAILGALLATHSLPGSANGAILVTLTLTGLFLVLVIYEAQRRGTIPTGPTSWA